MPTVADGTLEADLLVLGCGMAGMTAALTAAEQGQRVVCIDRAPHLGGTSVLSSAVLWTVRSVEDFRRHVPTGDPELGRVVVEELPRVVECVRRTGAEVSEPVEVLYGRGHRIDVATYVERAAQRVVDGGGWVLPGRLVDHLLFEDGVVGARLRDAESAVDLRAPKVLLATGGAQGSSAHLADLLGEDRWRHVLLRANSYSTGDGIRLATAVGAALHGEPTAFYGHLVAHPTDRFTPAEFTRLAMAFSTDGVVVDAGGERFVDESLADTITAQAVARLPGAKAVLLFDDAVRRGPAVTPSVRGTVQYDKVAEAAQAGARVATAPTWSELCEALRAWGFDGAVALRTVESFNDAIEAGGAPPRAPRVGNRRPLTAPPFHAIEVRPAITFTQRGIAIDEWARALDRDGEPIPGLYAAGADVGHVYNGGYAGGLALAGAFGRRAALHRPSGG